jgi:hypothetical protein
MKKYILSFILALTVSSLGHAQNVETRLYMYDAEDNALGCYADVVRLEFGDGKLVVARSNSQTSEVLYNELDYFAFKENGLNNSGTSINPITCDNLRYMICGDNIRIVASTPIAQVAAYTLSGELLSNIMPIKEDIVLSLVNHKVLLLQVKTQNKTTTLKIVR